MAKYLSKKKKRRKESSVPHAPSLVDVKVMQHGDNILLAFLLCGEFLSSLHTLFRQSRDVRGDMLLRVKRSVIGNMQEGGDSSKKMERLVGDSLTNRLNISLISSESPARMKEDLLCGT